MLAPPNSCPPPWSANLFSHQTEISALRSATRSLLCISKVIFSEMAPPGCTLILISEECLTSTSSACEETGFPSMARRLKWKAYFLLKVSR